MPAVILLLITPILVMVALGTFFGGTGTLLNFVDYTTLKDKVRFNRWAGRRLILLAVLAGASGIGALIFPKNGVLLLICFFFACFAIVFWIAAGSGKFTR